ncbi:MAG: DUF4340 domain-containing protein [Desulfomonilaceae bacterium]|nr:DUF4340 domain-containing protein [Desulfomonilaceae bacterium]
MNPGKVLIYLGVFVALAAYVYFVEIRHKQELEARKAEAEKIVKLDREKISQVSLKSADHGRIGLEQSAGTWVMTRPVAVKADSSSVRSLLNTISDAQYEKILKEEDVKWDEYGLDKPLLTVSVTTRDETYNLFFGALNPAKTSYYLRAKGDPRLFLVADTLKNALDKSVYDLRDKTVFGLAPDDVDRVLIVKEGTQTELKKETPDKWIMVKPDRMRVKASEIKRDLVNLTNLQARDIIDEPKKDGDPYGLENATERVELTGVKRSQTLIVGKAKEGEDKEARSAPDRYARIEGMDTVYLIDGRTLANLKTDPKDLQDKFVLDFKPDRIDKLEVELEGKQWSAVRSENGTWTLEKPQKREDVDSWPFMGLLWSLKNLEWKDMTKPAPSDLAAVHLDKPRLVVSLWNKDDKEPMTFKAGWKNLPARKTDSGTEKDPAGPSASDATDEKEPQEAAKEDTEGESRDTAPIPEDISVMVHPLDEKDALFTIDGKFVDRFREDLKLLSEEKDSRGR